jgi:hypothetical protein
MSDNTHPPDFDKMTTDTPPRPNGNTYWIVPLKFLAGEYPGDEDPVRARKKIKQFLAAGNSLALFTASMRSQGTGSNL